MEGINLEESGSEPLKPQICIFQARKSLDNDLIQSSHNYVDMYLAQDPTIGPCEALEGEQVAIKEGTPPDLKGAHLSVPIADDDHLVFNTTSCLDGDRIRKVRTGVEEVSWEGPSNTEQNDDDFSYYDDESSCTDMSSSGYDNQSHMGMASHSSASSTTMEGTIETFSDLTQLGKLFGIQDEQMWRNRLPTLLMLWTIEQARVRLENDRMANASYQHLPFPETPSLDHDAAVSDFLTTARIVPTVPGGPGKQPKFCSATPPLKGASVYSRPCPVPTHGTWKLTSGLKFSQSPMALIAKPFESWLPRCKGSALTKPAFSNFSPGSCVGALTTSGQQGGELVLFSWGEMDEWPYTLECGEELYLGKRWKSKFQRASTRVRPGQYARSKILHGGHVPCAKTFNTVEGCVWTSESSILVFGISNDLPAFELHEVDWKSPVAPRFRGSQTVSLDASSYVRDVAVESRTNEIFVCFDDGALLSLPVEWLGTERAQEASKWSFESSVGSIRCDPQTPGIVSLTLDFPDSGSQYMRIDTRISPSEGPCMQMGLERLVYSHDYAWDSYIICGDSLGFVTLYDERKLGSSYCDIFKDHSNCAIADVKYDRETRICTFSGSPSSSFWEHSNASKSTLRHVGNTMLDEGILTADHQVYSTHIPGSSLIALSSSAGSIGLLDL
jgi:hypothetical protein